MAKPAPGPAFCFHPAHVQRQQPGHFRHPHFHRELGLGRGRPGLAAGRCLAGAGSRLGHALVAHGGERVALARVPQWTRELAALVNAPPQAGKTLTDGHVDGTITDGNAR